MARPIQRLGLEPYLLKRLQSFHTNKEVLECSPLVLMERLDMPAATIAELLQIIASKSRPSPITALQMHRHAADRVQYLETYLSDLDSCLGGGISTGSLTEFVGPAGVGKSQMCLLLTASALLEPLTAMPQKAGKVLYIDTERKFSPQRLVQIAGARWPQHFRSSKAKDDLASRVLVITPSSSADLLARLNGLEAVMIEQSICLVVIDSIAILARADYGCSLQDRQALLGQQAATLKRIAETFRVPVVVTNQVTSQGQSPRVAFIGGTAGSVRVQEDAHLTAALGILWAHAVNTRFIMEVTGDTRSIQVAKSPTAPNRAFTYSISSAGLELTSQAQDSGGLNSNVLAQGIRHDLNYLPPQHS